MNGDIPSTNEANNFDLPKDYFQKSAAAIFAKIEWQEEHKGFSKLAVYKNNLSNYENGFVTPPKYFSNNEQKLELLEFPELLSLKDSSGFNVPLNYFEELEVTELGKVLNTSTHELEEFEYLKVLDKQNNFTLRENYFSDTEERLIVLLSHKKEARVINLFGRRLTGGIAAAVVLSLAYYIYSFYFAPVSVKDCGTMACVDKQDLMKTKNLENLDNDELYELVNPQKLEKKLKIEESTKAKKMNDSSLKNVSTEELLDEI